MKNGIITKTKTTYKISSISIDYTESGTGVKVLSEECDLVLEVSPDGEPVRLLLNNEQVNNLVGVLAGHATRSIVILQYP